MVPCFRGPHTVECHTERRSLTAFPRGHSSSTDRVAPGGGGFILLILVLVNPSAGAPGEGRVLTRQ